MDLKYVIKYFKKNKFLIPLEDSEAIAKGLSHFLIGDYKIAFEVFDEPLEKDENNAVVWFARGMCNFYEDRKEEALKDYNKTLALDNKIYDAYKKRAGLYWMLGEDEKALLDFENMIALDSSNVTPYRLRGSYYYENKNFQKAQQDFQKYLAVNSKDLDMIYNNGVCLANLGNHKEALKNYNKYLMYRPYHPELINLKILSLYQTGDMDRVISDCDTALLIYEFNGFANFYRGLARLNLGDFKEAEKSLTKAIYSGFKSYDVYVNRAIVRMELKDFVKAEYDIIKAVSIKPERPQAFYIKAKLMLLQNKDACETIKAAIKLGHAMGRSEYNKFCPSD